MTVVDVASVSDASVCSKCFIYFQTYVEVVFVLDVACAKCLLLFQSYVAARGFML